jgi:pimeloyl-ACP methyl ester carboxylesterase
MWGTLPVEGFEAELAAAGAQPTQPLLYLHGVTDGCLGVDLVRGLEGAVLVDGAGHFLHVEKPDEVNQHIVKFVGG